MSSRWPLSVAVRLGARVWLFEPGWWSEKPPTLPSLTRPRCPSPNLHAPSEKGRKGNRKSLHPSGYSDTVSNVQCVHVLRAPGPAFGSEDSYLLLTKTDSSRTWFPEVPPKPILQAKGRSVLSSWPGLVPGQMVPSVACPPRLAPHNGFRAGETLKEALVQSLIWGMDKPRE